MNDPLWLSREGEMARHIRDFDWSATRLGPIAHWPRSLGTALQIALGSRYPMFIGWGCELVHLYNDACIPVLGRRHPWALGQRARHVWHELWELLGPQTELVLEQGRATWNDDCFQVLERAGHSEEAYFSFSCSPLWDDGGKVGGVLCVSIETTPRVLGRRRVRSLHELSRGTSAEPRTTEAACRMAAEALADNPYDLPFVLIYLRDEARALARLAAAVGLAEGSPARDARIDLAAGSGETWPLGQVLTTGEAVVVDDLRERFGPLTAGVWPEVVQRALVLPIPWQDRVLGFIVAGISPRIALDDEYRGFCALLAAHLAPAIAHASASPAEEDRRALLRERDARAEAERASRVKDELLATVSHELRTPTSAALLWLAMLRQCAIVPRVRAELPRLERGLAAIERSVQAQMRLIEDLLDLSRIDAGKLRLEHDLLDLADVVQLAVDGMTPLADAKGVRMVARIEAARATVRGDGVRLQQVLWNLLDNAIKFTPRGGCVAVRLERADGECRLHVRDDGQGIDPRVLPHVFERFRQADASAARPRAGLGLGLAIVKQLVELHGGSVAATSEGAGRGATFSVSLPLAALPS